MKALDERFLAKYLPKALTIEDYIYLLLLENEELHFRTLYRALQEAGYRVSESQVLRVLLKLEIRGIVYVDDALNVRLEREKRFLVVDED